MGWGSGGSCTPRPPIRQQPASEPRVVTVIFLGLLLDLLAFTLLLPLLPGLLESHSRAHVSPPPCPDDPSPLRWLSTAPVLSGTPPAFVMLPCSPGPPLWLMAARGGLVCCSHRDASREEVQQCPVRRYGPEPHTGGPLGSYLPGPFPLHSLGSCQSQVLVHAFLLPGSLPTLPVECPLSMRSISV